MKKFVVVGGIAVLALIGIVSMQLKVKGLKVAGEGPAGAEQKLASATADSEDAIPPSMKSNSCGKSVKPLSAPLQALLLQDEREHNYAMLLAEIKSLGKDLSATDTAALMEMLAWPNDRFPKKMRPIEINAVKNDVLDKLLRQASLPEGLSLQLVEMAGDVNQDVVWRDYCIQFMDPLYKRLTTEYTKNTEAGAGTIEGSESRGGRALNNSVSSSLAGGEKSIESVQSVDELTVVREAMYGALEKRSSTIAGTALIGLENLWRTHEEFDRGLIAEKAVEMASDELVSMESRLTALRLSADLATEGTKKSDQTEVWSLKMVGAT